MKKFLNILIKKILKFIYDLLFAVGFLTPIFCFLIDNENRSAEAIIIRENASDK